MEHRWGQRWDVERAVNLRTRSGVGARGKVCNVSISGAFVATPLPVRLLSYVQVQFLAEHGARRMATSIEGQVVRRTAEGFALEWCDFAPEAVFALAGPPDMPGEPDRTLYPLIHSRQR